MEEEERWETFLCREKKDAFSRYGGLFDGKGYNKGISAPCNRDKIKVVALLDCNDDRSVKSPL